MTRTFMHPRIAELARALLPMIDNSPEKPTQVDRDALLSLRYIIKNLSDEPGIEFSDADDIDRQYLYVESTLLANRQEEYYERNGNKFAPMTKEQLLAMGGDAPLDQVLRTYSDGGLSSFAQQELPGVRRALRTRTIGELAAKTRLEITGPQGQNAGNKTLSWIEAVCMEFKIAPPR